MTSFRVVASILLMLLAGFVVVMNWSCVIVSSRNRRKGIDKHHSTVPLISLLLAAAAAPVFPYRPGTWVWFIPAADIGNWLLLIGLPWLIFRGIFKRKPPEGPR